MEEMDSIKDKDIEGYQVQYVAELEERIEVKVDRIKDKDIEGYQVQQMAELEERMEEEMYVQDQGQGHRRLPGTVCG